MNDRTHIQAPQQRVKRYSHDSMLPFLGTLPIPSILPRDRRSMTSPLPFQLISTSYTVTNLLGQTATTTSTKT